MKTISYTELQVSNIVHFHGARFEIISVKWCEENPENIKHGMPDVFMSAQGKWLDGEEIRGYFSSGTTWHFQGNIRARCTIE